VTPTAEQVERAAIAALGEFCRPTLTVRWNELQPVAKEKWRRIARAALTANDVEPEEVT
jgi:hypothetical protein